MGHARGLPKAGKAKVKDFFFRCGCRVQETQDGRDDTVFYFQREVSCHKPHRVTRGIINAWKRREGHK